MERIIGVVQHYAWGDHRAIPELLDRPPDQRPWAELWLGSHPGGPSHTTGGQPVSTVYGELPYLLKVLAAAQPLSLQTHPDRRQAEEGFARDEQAGLALDDPRRTYRDRSPKPEVLCALTPFDALSGFRPVEQTVTLLDDIGVSSLSDRLRHDGLEAVVRELYRGSVDLAEIVRTCATSSLPAARLVTDLARAYPDDPSVAVTLLLHRVALEPGEAIFLGPGNLHAYLSGVGVEVMSASDNVLRAGLTVKHVDVDQLLQVVSFDPVAEPRTIPTQTAPHSWRYDTPNTPFRLWRWQLDEAITHTATGRELVLCVDGDAGPIRRGECMILARGETIVLGGPATLFRVEERPIDR
jgi:mannose-6-phosphate isomerase